MRDEMNGDLSALIDAAREGDDPGAPDRERVRRRLMARLGAGALATTAVTATATAAPAVAGVSTGAGLLTKLVVVALAASTAAGVGVGVVAVRARHHTETASAMHPIAPAPLPAPPPVVARVEVLRVQPPTARVEPPAVSSEPPARRIARVGVVAPAVAPADEDLASLHRARALLQLHRPADALLELAHQAAHYPVTSFAPERHLERAIALCDLGRADEGRRELTLAAHDAPAHPDLPSAREACRLDAP